jgi:hypothetical protein
VRGETWLRYAARAAGDVTLEIHDVRGRLVSRLVRHARGDGVIRVEPWLTDDVASGVYFAVLTAGTERLTRKIVVAK